ncbi:MAG: hypothetical protein ABIH76_00515, partial [Candidatus Bathyarchaeota archaeon]
AKEKQLNPQKMAEANIQRINLLLAALNNCFEALRYRVFQERYINNPQLRLTTTDIIESPQSDNEKMLTSLYSSLNLLSHEPHKADSRALFNTIYQTKSILLSNMTPILTTQQKPNVQVGVEHGNGTAHVSTTSLIIKKPKK